MANDTSSIEVRTNQVRSVFGSIPNCIQFHTLVQSATNELWISVINRLLPFSNKVMTVQHYSSFWVAIVGHSDTEWARVARIMLESIRE